MYRFLLLTFTDHLWCQKWSNVRYQWHPESIDRVDLDDIWLKFQFIFLFSDFLTLSGWFHNIIVSQRIVASRPILGHFVTPKSSKIFKKEQKNFKKNPKWSKKFPKSSKKFKKVWKIYKKRAFWSQFSTKCCLTLDETNLELCINVDRTSEHAPLMQDIASKIDAKRVKNGVPKVDQKVSNRTLMFWGTG